MQYRADIDGLRAVAVLLVVFYHAAPDLLPGGFVGVDVFFVISGYLIGKIILSDDVTILHFYARRLRRVYPALVVMMLTTTLVGWFVFWPDQYEAFAASLLHALTFNSNLHFWQSQNNYFAESSELLPLLHTWSLAIEAQFYLLFPLIRLLPKHHRNFFILVALVASFLVWVYASQYRAGVGFYFFPARAWELLTGAALVAFQVNEQGRQKLSYIGLFGVAIAVYFQAPLLAVVGSALVVSGGRNAALELRPIVFVGLISYSIYLWHWPILVLARIRFDSVDLSPAELSAAISVAFVVSAVSWRTIETPGRKTRFRWGAFQLVGSAAVVACALVILENEGLTERLPPKAAAIWEAMDDDLNRDRCLSLEFDPTPCTFGAQDNEPSIAIWGDSHADALVPAFASHAASHGFSGVAYAIPGCPPLNGVEVLTGFSAGRCEIFNHQVRQSISSNDSIKAVFIVARWSVYRPGEVNLSQSVLSSLKKTIDTISNLGKSVYVIGGVPELDWNVPKALAAASRWGVPLPPTPMRHDVAKRNIEVTSQSEHMNYIDLSDRLCDERCRVEDDDGSSLYKDDDHLSTVGALYVLDLIKSKADLSGDYLRRAKN